jgi:cytoplasmic iron level regulating protein YaaA (DUF328/UPF0246 family)
VLAPQREAVAASLVALSARPDEAARVLKLSPRQLGAIDDNAALRTAHTMPAVDRYTGVLFDALDAPSLDEAARAWLGEHALIHTAPFGPVGALDPIPAYRLAAGASLPGLPPLRRLWAEATTAALAGVAPLVIDLRSEAYAAFGPVPTSVPSTYIRVVTEGPDGAVRALNHFNKKAKGELTRRLALARPVLAAPEELVAWGREAGLVLRPAARHGEIELVV